MATLLGDATLTTSSSIPTLDPIVATNNASNQQTTAFRKPVSMDRLTEGGGAAILYTGTFAGISTIGAADLKKYADPGYVDDFTEDPQPLTVNTAGQPFNPSNNQLPAQTPRLFFDFSEIRELTTTTIDEVTFKITITPSKLFNMSTPFASVSTGQINVNKTNFSTEQIFDDTKFGSSQTITLDQQSTHTFTCTDSTYLSHSGTFLPIAVEIQIDKLGQFTIDSVECQVKYTGKTFIKGDYVKNDTLGYTQTAGDGSTVRPGEKQGRLRALDASATDEISFNWNAGRFSKPTDAVVGAMQISEYIQITRGQGASSTAYPYSPDLFTALETGQGSSMGNTKVENAQYTMTQGGSDKGNVFPNTERDWQVDLGDFSAHFGGAGNRSVRNELARPNVLTDQTISNIDRTDLSTAISLKVPFAGADTTPALSSGNNAFNMGNEWEHYQGTGNSPTGNSAWEDLHSADRGSFVDDRAPYRSQVLPAATQAYLRFLFSPNVLGSSNILGTFTKTFGILGVKHGLSASDVGTQTASFTQTGQGGFLLEGSATISSAMTFGINAGFQLSVIESESTTATMTFDDAGLRLAIRAEATPTGTFALTEDVDLFVGGEAPMISAFTKTMTVFVGIILTIDTVLELPALASSMTVVAAGESLPGPDLARTFVLEAEANRTLTVVQQTRTNTVNTQTRTAAVDPQTRISTADSQNKETALTRWDQSPTWRGYKTWATGIRPRVLTIPGYDG